MSNLLEPHLLPVCVWMDLCVCWLGCCGESEQDIETCNLSPCVFVLCHAEAYVCVCVRERWQEGLCVCVCGCAGVCAGVGANVGIHHVPSVMPQSEISLVANNSKTRKWPKGGETDKYRFITVFPKTKSLFHIIVSVIMLLLYWD